MSGRPSGWLIAWRHHSEPTNVTAARWHYGDVYPDRDEAERTARLNSQLDCVVCEVREAS